MLRDALRSVESIVAPTFIIWRGARRCYFNAAARAAFPASLGESGNNFARATPFVQDLVRIVERRGESKEAARLTLGDLEFVSIPLFNYEGVIEGTIVRAGRFEDIPEMYREFQTRTSLISQIVHLLPVLVYTVRPSGEYDFVNRSFVEYAGLALQRGGRIDLENVVHPEDREKLPMPWNGGDESRDLFTAEVGLRHNDGAFRCHAVRLSAIRSQSGAVVKWIGTLVDIEDRLLAEASLAEAHEFLDARVDELERVLEVVPVGIAIANGFESDEVLLNRAMMELLDETSPYVPYGHRAFRYLRGVDLEQIDPSAGGVEIEYQRADGATKTIAVTVVPTKKIDGNGGVVAAYIDVTAQRNEERRREALLAAHRALSIAKDRSEIGESLAVAFAGYADGCEIATPARDSGDDERVSDGRDDGERRTATLTDAGFGLSIPLAVGGRASGAITLRRDASRTPFDARDVEVMTDFGRVAALSLDRASILERERAIALQLNRLLLPARLPQLSHVDVSVAFCTAAGASPTGADWYDVFDLPGDRIGFSVGDVAGQGIEAEIAMYAVRQTIRDAAFAGASPAGVLASANAFVHERTPERFATACFAIVDVARRTVRYALAGHPPPIVASREGATRVLATGGLPLGMRAEALRHESHVDASELSVFALYTKGVTKHDRDAVAGEEDLRRSVESASVRGGAAAAQTIFDDMFRSRPAGDDAVLLIVRFPEHAPPRVLPAAPAGTLLATTIAGD